MRAGLQLVSTYHCAMAYVTYRVVETGASAALAYATGGATTVPQAVGYIAKSRSMETSSVPPQTSFAPLPPPATA